MTCPSQYPVQESRYNKRTEPPTDLELMRFRLQDLHVPDQHVMPCKPALKQGA